MKLFGELILMQLDELVSVVMHIAIKYNLKTGQGIPLSLFCPAQSISRFPIKAHLPGQIQAIHCYAGEKSSAHLHKLLLVILLSGNKMY